MTRQDLENYIYLQGEIEDLRLEVANLKSKSAQIVSDTVQGSSNEYPFTQHPISIRGCDASAREKYEQKKTLLYNRITELEQKKAEISQWIDSVPQVRMRRLLRYRYIDRLKWSGIAARLGYTTENSARMAHNNFLNKMLQTIF